MGNFDPFLYSRTITCEKPLRGVHSWEANDSEKCLLILLSLRDYKIRNNSVPKAIPALQLKLRHYQWRVKSRLKFLITCSYFVGFFVSFVSWILLKILAELQLCRRVWHRPWNNFILKQICNTDILTEVLLMQKKEKEKKKGICLCGYFYC